MAAALGSLALLILGSLGFARLASASARECDVAAPRSASRQRSRRSCGTIDSATDALRKQLQHVQKQNTEIRAAASASAGPRPSPCDQKTSCVRAGSTLAGVAARVRALSSASRARLLAMSPTRSARLAHARAQPAPPARSRARADDRRDPSINPGRRAPIVGRFGWRIYPDVEFHPGRRPRRRLRHAGPRLGRRTASSRTGRTAASASRSTSITERLPHLVRASFARRRCRRRARAQGRDDRPASARPAMQPGRICTTKSCCDGRADRPDAVSERRPGQGPRDTSRSAERVQSAMILANSMQLVAMAAQRSTSLIMLVYALVSWVPSLRGRWTRLSSRCSSSRCSCRCAASSRRWAASTSRFWS